MPFKKVDPKVSFPKMEEEILKYWEDNKIFEKSVAQREGAKRYSFYDGPPFATGLPHYGHLVGSIMKDTVPRYWTMKGFQVERRWGWDCHGLPIENIAEKELGIKHKKDIEELGVAKFNEFCRSKVMEYATEWEKIIPRIGRWVDMKNAYKTMDLDYMESIWWVFKELWDKGLIYEGYRSMHICPRCETTLSQQEVSEEYVDVKDLSVTAKFELVDDVVIPASEPESKDWIPGQARDDREKTYILAWTTTPWTLPGNVALAVGKDMLYRIAEIEYSTTEKFKLKSGEKYIVANGRFQEVFGGTFDNQSHKIRYDDGTEIKFVWSKNHLIPASQLVGKSYKPIFDYYWKDEKLENRGNGWKIYAADFVTTEDGTGVVHIAPAFGDDDMNLGKEQHLPFVQHVNMDGTMKPEVTDFAGMLVKPKEDPQLMDVEIIKYLAKNGSFFSKEKYEHSYPHCWRCHTPLLNYATSSWFVSVTKVKERAIELAGEINWSPSHIKEGRFGKWLEGARDWSISRQRYWASVMPIWKCECGETLVFGSVKELEEASGQKVEDLHKHIVDGITVPCTKCGSAMHRIPDVLDTWFDSGSMPYAQAHYPFADKEKFEEGFPAQYIAEGVDQTRAWFYYLHVLGTAIEDKPAFQNVIVNGIVLAEDGKKMSKSLKNYPDPMEVVHKHGADALRLYLLSSPVVAAENLDFSERDLTESTRNLFRMLWNSYSFFVTYANIDDWQPTVNKKQSTNLLDRWILSELQMLVRDVNGSMERYDLAKATRAFAPFIDNLSNWYIRRSRDRFWKNENDEDKEDAYATLHHVLVELAKLMAPFTPFLAEEMYRNLSPCHAELVSASQATLKQVQGDTDSESVHLADWPVVDEGLIDSRLNSLMLELRTVVSEGLRQRAEKKMKVRQPLSRIYCSWQKMQIEYMGTLSVSEKAGVESILKEELNVKEIGDGGHIDFDWQLTEALNLEGEMNEINRAIQHGRKKAGFNVEDRIVLGYQGKEKVFEMFGEEIAKKVLATELKNKELASADYAETVDLDGTPFSFWLMKNV